MDFSNIGKWIIVAGLVVTLVGGAVWLVGKMGLPLGRLPGDIHIERGGSSFYFPLATSIVISLFLTLVINIILRLFKR